MEAIKIEKISKTFGKTVALNKLSFSVEKGTIHWLIGHNGSGKTTLLKILNSFCLPDSGSFFINGKSYQDSDYNKNLAFVSSEQLFPVNRKVEDYILDVCILRDLNEKEVLKQLENSSLREYRQKLCDDLSLGWRKILQLFVCGLFKPEILILDEPFNGLDVFAQKLLQEQIIEFNKRGGTLLISTHIEHYAENLVDNVTLIEEGNLVYHGKKDAKFDIFYKKWSDDSFEKRSEKEKLFNI